MSTARDHNCGRLAGYSSDQSSRSAQQIPPGAEHGPIEKVLLAFFLAVLIGPYGKGTLETLWTRIHWMGLASAFLNHALPRLV